MSITLAWTVLIIAGVLEALWAISLKLSDGFTKLFPTVMIVVFTILIFYMLSKVMKVLPTGIAYCVWTGISILCLTAIEYFFFGIQMSWIKIFSIFLIIIGIFGLR
ncbi:DMT family transporter [Halarcobacter anaerophilus]|uniref:Guanidinium exporter n=1 Tax=Halarcobacter anaerophilus TaxID=877500 RepID=A0A4Q0Y3F7_9BACT|nr:SMR family transporter [Halarcobacter anaerophilus]QDF29451.1 QacE family quaternary ammonium compound efflux SMR transporter [Halarcobacter anaerophilus]RXJ64696.1 QacE family quaternary ammonium compound efflux SMR transporter [Halarcobacter anaerophilus]